MERLYSSLKEDFMDRRQRITLTCIVLCRNKRIRVILLMTYSDQTA